VKKHFQNWCNSPGRKTLVMGIINVTPDSFSDGGKYVKIKNAINHAKKMVNDGADIIDVGGESTRPGADEVSISEELRRVIPVVESIRSNFPDLLISIDTTKSVVAHEAVKAGADIINDVSGLDSDIDMVGMVANLKVPIIIMHMKGNPRNMQINPKYKNLIGEITSFFEKKIKIATELGINRNLIIIDPGIGFGKTINHNFEIISKLKEFSKLDLPIMIGPSRKSFIGKTLNLPVESRIEGTSAAITASILNGANIVRVHDVLEMKRVAEITEKIRMMA
tara:strand:- start:421 stop:1260 length:840 start_codon:yes stop_codon:yes gene_type:complete